jgi:hypothetical protein
MADGMSILGEQARSNRNTSPEGHVGYGTKALCCTEQQLRAALIAADASWETAQRILENARRR